MATKKTAMKGTPHTRDAKTAAVGPSSLLFHRVSTLLHTIRCIAKHEDELCVLMQDLKDAGRIRSETRRDLYRLLEAMPAHEYASELDSVRDELDKRAQHLVAATSPARKQAKTPEKAVKSPGRRSRSQR